MNITPRPDIIVPRDVEKYLRGVGWDNAPMVFEIGGYLFAYVSMTYSTGGVRWSLVTPAAGPVRENFVRLENGWLLNKTGTEVAVDLALALDAFVMGHPPVPIVKPWYLTTGKADHEWENQP